MQQAKILVAACGIQSPDKGSNPGSLHWECIVLATGPPRNALLCCYSKLSHVTRAPFLLVLHTRKLRLKNRLLQAGRWQESQVPHSCGCSPAAQAPTVKCELDFALEAVESRATGKPGFLKAGVTSGQGILSGWGTCWGRQCLGRGH